MRREGWEFMCPKDTNTRTWVLFLKILMEVLPWCSWNYLEGTASLNPSRARLPSWGRLLSNAAQPIIYMPGVCLILLFLIRCPELRQDSTNLCRHQASGKHQLLRKQL